MAETALLPSLAHEARGYFSAALAADPARAAAVAIGRARLELAVLHPDAALEAIDEVVVAEGDAESAPVLAARSVEKIEPAEMEMLLALRDEAVMATHALPWESASALASYHPASPPPFVRRRLSAARRLSGLHARGATGGAGVDRRCRAGPTTRQHPRGPALKSPEADVCLLVEGTYPFVSGGVSSWVHDIILGHPELRFAVLNVGSHPGAYGEPRYPAARQRGRPAPRLLPGDGPAAARRGGARRSARTDPQPARRPSTRARSRRACWPACAGCTSTGPASRSRSRASSTIWPPTI